MKRGLLYLFLFLLFSCSRKITSPEKTVVVPNDFLTIQDAINNVESEQTILVNPGLYAENLNYYGKEIAVVSSSW